MSFPNPPEQQPPYPPAPGFGPPPTPARLRGRTPRRLGWILLAAAVVLFLVGGIIIATKSLGKVNDFDRVPIAAGSGTASFDDPGGYLAYYEAPGLDVDRDSPPNVRVWLTSPSGKRTELRTLYGGGTTTIKRLTYDYNGHDGAALFEFHISEPGTYRVEIQSEQNLPPGATMAFGKSIAGGTVVGALLIVLGVLALIAAVVLLIVGYVKRSRHKKELQSAAAWGAPPPGYGGPPPGYGGPPPEYGTEPPGFTPPPSGRPPEHGSS